MLASISRLNEPSATLESLHGGRNPWSFAKPSVSLLQAQVSRGLCKYFPSHIMSSLASLCGYVVVEATAESTGGRTFERPKMTSACCIMMLLCHQ